MPSPIISGSSSINGKPTDSRTSVTKAKRLVRRRGRGRGDMSDEEFEREALTDSSDTQSTFDSDSDSEAEGPSAKSPVNGGAYPAKDSDFVRSSAPSPAPKSVPNSHKSVIPPSTNWSDMVTADEASANNLPVVDFDDLGKLAADTNVATHDSPSTSTLTPAQLKAAKQKAKRKAKKEKLKALSLVATAAPGPSSTSAVPPGDNPQPGDEVPSSPVTGFKPVSAPSQHPSRPPKPTPRQAYLERLTNDPSYVPRVGAFWGHDDRLMDKELRSMSPWWRGRGRGGRGRGGAYAPTGRDPGLRGRGGFGLGRARGRGFGPLSHQHSGSDAGPLPGSSVPSREPSMSGTPPEIKDDTRTHSPSSHGHWSEARGRGGARGRGRARGGGAGAPAKVVSRVRGSSSTPQPPDQGAKPTPARSVPRPGKKTERAWTKPLDESLIANATGDNPRRHTRQNSSVAPPSPASSDVRIKLPGASSPTSVQIQPENPSAKPQPATPSSSERVAEQRSNTPSSAEQPKPAIVKLPIRQKVRVSGPVAAAASAAAKSVKSPLSAEIKLPSQSDVAVLDARVATTEEQLADEKDPFVVHVPPDEDRANIVRQTLSTSAVSSSPIPSQKLPANSSPPDPSSRPESAAPPPFAPAYIAPQTAFAHLPPGVGYSENGMLFELATGRPVILAPPQPAPMFQPPPRMPYVPSLTHEYHPAPPAGTPPPLSHPFGANGYPSADSPRYSPYPPETTPVDASAPIFVPARPSAIEIRAPSVDGESSGSKSSSGTSASSLSISASTAGAKPPKQSVKAPSNLRTSVSATTEPNVPDGMSSATKGDSLAPQPPFAPQPYAPGQYYYPGPDYAVYAPVPVGVDGQPQYGVFYPEAQYGIPPYGDPNPYASYGTVYYGPGPYGTQAPASNEAEVPRFY